MIISILLVEDDPLLSKLLAKMLEAEDGFSIAGVVRSGCEVPEALDRARPDILLLDIHLPGMSGLTVLERLVPRGERPRTIVLTGEEDEATALRAAELGAHGFVAKSDAVAVLPQAIRAVARDDHWLPPAVLRQILNRYPSLVRVAQRLEGPLASLTEREREVLVRVARGMTNQQIARDLSMGLSTVKMHLGSTLQKLDVSNRTEAALLAAREGLLADAEAPAEGTLRHAS